MPLITDGKIEKGFFRERVLLKSFFGEELLVPEPIYNYAKKISEFTDLPLEEVIKSEPIKNMIKKWTKFVRL